VKSIFVRCLLRAIAGYGFENPNNTASYRAEDGADAWKHMVNFLASTLKK
jgi:dienelactone hydrolase